MERCRGLVGQPKKAVEQKIPAINYRQHKNQNGVFEIKLKIVN